MIVGDPKTFAIESEITVAYTRLSFRALGLFVIHVRDQRYGVYEPDATLLACSLDEVETRIAKRGTHVLPILQQCDASTIAETFASARYRDCSADECLGIPPVELDSMIAAAGVDWAPDGDEAFDDGSFVLQFDVEDMVRLIGFKRPYEDGSIDPSTLTDVQLPADQFYGILSEWRDGLLAAWESADKKAD